MLRNAYLRSHRLVLRRNQAEVAELVDHVGKAPRSEEHVDGRRLVLLVDLDEPEVEPLDGESVLVPEVAEADRLQLVELVQLVEAPLVQREVRLERSKLCGHVADAVLERVDLRRQAADL